MEAKKKYDNPTDLFISSVGRMPPDMMSSLIIRQLIGVMNFQRLIPHKILVDGNKWRRCVVRSLRKA